MIREEKKKVVDKKLEGVAYNTSNLLLRLLRYEPSNKKINIICRGVHIKVSGIDNMIIRCDDADILEVEDYGLPYGDIMEMYLPFNVKSIDSISKELANRIDNDEMFNKYNSIVLIGVGEGGLYMVNVAKFLHNRTVRIATIATPFNGTMMADERFVRHKTKNPIDKFIYAMIYNKMKRKYHFPNRIISGMKFVSDIKYPYLAKHRWINFVASHGDARTLEEAFQYRLAKKVFNSRDNDGIVSVLSQECDRKELDKKYEIVASHEESLFKALEYFKG